MANTTCHGYFVVMQIYRIVQRDHVSGAREKLEKLKN